MNFDLKAWKTAFAASERFITGGIHLGVMQQSAITSQCKGARYKSLLGQPYEAFMSSVSENTQISLIEDSESPHECVSERCLCVLRSDLPSVYSASADALGILVVGWTQEISE